MAARKTNRKASQGKASRGSQVAVIFWLAFIIIIVSVFMANADVIKENFNLFKTRLTTSPGTEVPPLAEDETPEETVIPPPVIAVREPAREPEPADPQPAAQNNTQNTAQDRPAAQTQQPQTQQPVQLPQPVQSPQTAQTRDRNIYYTQIDKDGHILHSRVNRKIPVSDSPMQDALNIMLIGPSADELNRGIINLIPKNTRVLSATVRGSTAYISFSEDFLFNTFGVEGYVAQLRQIVWTVTEFSNVKDVQILIEGKRLDYLGEGIWIGSPISRQSF